MFITEEIDQDVHYGGERSGCSLRRRKIRMFITEEKDQDVANIIVRHNSLHFGRWKQWNAASRTKYGVVGLPLALRLASFGIAVGIRED